MNDDWSVLVIEECSDRCFLSDHDLAIEEPVHAFPSAAAAPGGCGSFDATGRGPGHAHA